MGILLAQCTVHIFHSSNYYLFWVLVDMIKDFLYQRYNNQLLKNGLVKFQCDFHTLHLQ